MTTNIIQRTLLTDRMIAAYHRMHRWEELTMKLRKMGFTYEVDELYDIGTGLVEQFGLLSEQRRTCYICGKPHEPALGRLCSCFHEVIVQDFFDLRDRKTIDQLPGNVIVTTGQCDDCGIPVPVPAKVVQAFYANHPKATYRGRRYCHQHWLQRRKLKAAKKREEKRELQAVQEQAAAEPVKTHLDLSSVQLPDAPRGTA